MTPRARIHVGRWPALAVTFIALGAISPDAVEGQRHYRAAAIPDSVTVAAGDRYAAGPLKRFLLGSGYRDLWVTPIQVPVFRPDTFAGGLEVLERGGGRQTQSLRFGADDGREFVFRSIDKDQSGGFHEDLDDTWIDDIVQDQVSAKHPGGAPLVAYLMEATGVLHATPIIVVMADDPSLGEFREEFAGMLGIFEARPTETDGAGAFGDFERIISTERLFERVVESSEDRVDSREYLKARLMDLLIGDWDRHADQWRWAEVERNGVRYWLPIPRDRDNAFFSVDGMAGTVGRAVRPFVVRYDATYPSIYGLTYNARELDRKFLTGLPLAVWDSVALDLRNRLSDNEIAEAVRRMPPAYQALSGAELEAELVSRRESLSWAAREFYALVATEADLFGTDSVDVAEIERRDDGTLLVRVRTEGQDDPYVERVFQPAETREVRLHMLAGDDRVLVSGGGQSATLVRVVGGEGNDHLEDAATTDALTVFYDDRGENEIVLGPGTVVDTRRFVVPEPDTLTQNNQPPPRDFGTDFSWFATGIGWRSEIGPVLEIGPQWTRYGFRRLPYASRTAVQLQYAPRHNRFGIAAEFERILTGSDRAARLTLLASQLGVARFHGFGNETEDGPDPKLNRVWWSEFSATGELVEFISDRFEIGFGPTVSLIDPDAIVEDTPADLLDPAGTRSFGLIGVHAGAAYDGRDFAPYPRNGVFVELNTDWYPLYWGDAEEPFVRSGLTASYYLPVPLPLETTLALRAGGETVWGDPPFQFAPFLGGSRTLRGFRTRRFIGDSSVFGSAELRTALGRADLGLAKGDIGTIVLTDIGRVFSDGEDSDKWHSALGGGLWFGPVDRTYTVHAIIAAGERLDFSVGLGVPF